MAGERARPAAADARTGGRPSRWRSFTVLLGVDKLAEQVPEWLVWAFFVTFTAVPIAMLVQMVRARLAHAAVGDLLVRLQQDPAPERLEGALARVLRDPTLTIAFWLPEYESYAALDGRPMDVTAEAPGRAATPIDREGGGSPCCSTTRRC